MRLRCSQSQWPTMASAAEAINDGSGELVPVAAFVDEEHRTRTGGSQVYDREKKPIRIGVTMLEKEAPENWGPCAVAQAARAKGRACHRPHPSKRMDKKKVVAPLVCHGHSRPVVDLFYSPVTPDGFFLVSASKEMERQEIGSGPFKDIKVQCGAVASINKPCALPLHLLIFLQQVENYMPDSMIGCRKLWDALTGDELHSFEHKHIARACSFSEDSHLLLTGGMEKVLRIFDLNRPDAPPREIEKSPGSVRTISWLHSDQTILGSCTDMGGVRYRSTYWLWDVRTGTIVWTLETKASVTSAEVSQDGRYITTADGTSVKFWDANHFGLVKSYEMPCIVESASMEPKYGNKFIAGGEDMWVHMFDFHTGVEIGCNKGHHGPVHCVRFSPGGESYSSGSEDGTIRIWQTAPLNNSEEVTSGATTHRPSLKEVDQVTHQIENVQIAEHNTNDVSDKPSSQKESEAD
ncbi:hypothetical protein SASPL_110213 [Salvia splendens]|uniref:Serine-threonine kinase receptor-associated protein n=1 Tax=Salvia splendens TaxID=180675 RepID=A0A8X8Y491_SALSN|nr:hypothetical protein SASPL_110213 [Salvia splendens]